MFKMTSNKDDNKAEELEAGLKSRCKDVFNFDALKPTKLSESKELNEVNEPGCSSVDEDTKQHKGKESLFRVPDQDFKLAAEAFKPPKREDRAVYKPPKRDIVAPPKREEFRKPMMKRRGRTPDFRANPEKYTKYSLKDVDLLNNRSNSQAAFDFLQEIKEKGSEEEEKFDGQQRIVFKKKAPNEGEGSEKAPKQGEASEKLPKKKEKKSKTMALSHLMDDEEEDE